VIVNSDIAVSNDDSWIKMIPNHVDVASGVMYLISQDALVSCCGVTNLIPIMLCFFPRCSVQIKPCHSFLYIV
jgi:hypothetical protein